MTKLRKALFAVGALISVFVVPSESIAQGQQRNGFGVVPPPLTERDVSVIESLLSLDQDQSDLLREMLDVSLASYEEAQAKYAAYVEQVRETIRTQGRDPELMQEVRDVRANVQELVTTLREVVYEDLQLVLTEDQLDAWPAVERRDRRKAELGSLRVTGASLDLIETLNRVSQSETALDDGVESARQVAMRYETDIDRLLVKAAALRQDLSDAEGDDRAKVAERYRGVSVEVRDSTMAYADRITQALTGKTRERFSNVYWRAALPRQAGGSPAAVFSRIESIADLTDQQRQDIETLRINTQRRIKPIDEALRKDWYAWEEDRPTEEFMNNRRGRRAGRSVMDSIPDVIRKHIDERTELMEQLRSQLRIVLTADQLESVLPAREEGTGRPQRPTF